YQPDSVVGSVFGDPVGGHQAVGVSIVCHRRFGVRGSKFVVRTSEVRTFEVSIKDRREAGG
ncbi:MAG: hypothetical protein PVF33_14130, partial [Candidatus Latescibacterota bacterium]